MKVFRLCVHCKGDAEENVLESLWGDSLAVVKFIFCHQFFMEQEPTVLRWLPPLLFRKRCSEEGGSQIHLALVLSFLSLGESVLISSSTKLSLPARIKAIPRWRRRGRKDGKQFVWSGQFCNLFQCRKSVHAINSWALFVVVPDFPLEAYTIQSYWNEIINGVEEGDFKPSTPLEKKGKLSEEEIALNWLGKVEREEALLPSSSSSFVDPIPNLFDSRYVWCLLSMRCHRHRPSRRKREKSSTSAAPIVDKRTRT